MLIYTLSPHTYVGTGISWEGSAPARHFHGRSDQRRTCLAKNTGPKLRQHRPLKKGKEYNRTQSKTCMCASVLVQICTFDLRLTPRTQQVLIRSPRVGRSDIVAVRTVPTAVAVAVATSLVGASEPRMPIQGFVSIENTEELGSAKLLASKVSRRFWNNTQNSRFAKFKDLDKTTCPIPGQCQHPFPSFGGPRHISIPPFRLLLRTILQGHRHVLEARSPSYQGPACKSTSGIVTFQLGLSPNTNYIYIYKD